MQVQANLQVFLNIVPFGMDTQLAVEAPRFVSYSHPDSFEPHAYYPGPATWAAACIGAVRSHAAPPMERPGRP